MQIIAFVIAFCVWYLGSTDDYKAALKLWKGGDDAKYAWAFLTAVVYAYLVIWLNVFGMHFKERVIRQGNLRANMFCLGLTFLERVLQNHSDSRRSIQPVSYELSDQM